MLLTCDPHHNVAYLRFREKVGPVETIRVSDELNVDLAPDGTVHGLELLNANGQLAQAGGGRIIVVDEASDSQREFPITG